MFQKLLFIPFCLLFAFATTAQAGWEEVSDFDGELKGVYKGTWSAKGSSGTIKINFGGDIASFHVKDGGKDYRWVADVTIKNGSVILKTSFRTDTIKVQTKGGKMRLVGKYTYEGRPWGKYKLKPES